uniref:Putative sex-lethal family splicing factor n=1 Tax=Corethrella appendiculata TaxID=1370023 RepID=U5EQ96_9DIPT
MYSKMNTMNGYPSTFRSSSSRLWGMSHSLPSGMSNYASYGPPQDTDFTYTRARMYDMPSSSTFGTVPNTSSSSTSSLTGLNNLSSNNATTNLIINYLPQDMAERELHSMFSTMGPLESCKIIRDLKTGYSYGFGFVNYMSDEAATRAIKCLNGYTIRNKRIKVSYARPQGDELRETNLYITNLPRTITEQQLDVIFGKYGTIVQKNILRDKITGTPRGVAFVRYNKREEAQEAISALNNVIPQGGNQPLTVRVAEEHGRAKAALYLPAYNSFVHNNRDELDGLLYTRKKSYAYPY